MNCRNYLAPPNGYEFHGEHTYVLPAKGIFNLAMNQAALNNCKVILESNAAPVVHIGTASNCLGERGGWFKSLHRNEDNDHCYVLVAVGRHVNGNNYAHEWHTPINALEAWQKNKKTSEINDLCESATWTQEWLNSIPGNINHHHDDL